MGGAADTIHEEIKQRLADIEQNHQVRILYACESGSRAWGFDSQDSDYDVRFIYVRPRDWYLPIAIERKPDVIELPINDLLDINGWDIRKTLQLFQKSNPPLNEWLASPIVYLQRGRFADRVRELAAIAYNPVAAHYHYVRMASTNFRAYLKGETVRRKKYLYVLRPLLAVNWIEQELSVVPIQFDQLVAGTVTDDELLSEIKTLLKMKRAGSKFDEGPRFPAIHAFIEAEMSRHADPPKQEALAHSATEDLNAIFRDTVYEDASTDLYITGTSRVQT